jgi:hypothetical protein
LTQESLLERFGTASQVENPTPKPWVGFLSFQSLYRVGVETHSTDLLIARNTDASLHQSLNFERNPVRLRLLNKLTVDLEDL